MVADSVQRQSIKREYKHLTYTYKEETEKKEYDGTTAGDQAFSDIDEIGLVRACELIDHEPPHIINHLGINPLIMRSFRQILLGWLI